MRRNLKSMHNICRVDIRRCQKREKYGLEDKIYNEQPTMSNRVSVRTARMLIRLLIIRLLIERGAYS